MDDEKTKRPTANKHHRAHTTMNEPTETLKNETETTVQTPANPTDDQQKTKVQSKKRKKNQQPNTRYDGITCIPRESTGRPGTPHRFFASSYTVQMTAPSDHIDGSPDPVINTNTNVSGSGQVVHRHANGLAVVTAGSLIQNILANAHSTTDSSMQITDIKFALDITESQSVGGKRKKARKMKSGGGNAPGVVKPNDTLAVVTFSNGATVDMKCCVAGTLLELNERLVGTDEESKKKCLSLFSHDPLLDGYLAVIMPAGFPPIKKDKEES